MKKLLIFLLAALTAFGAAGCGKEKGDFGRYESVAGRPADAVFSFESALGEEKPPYPLSDGRTFYISAEGNAENDGLSESEPLDLATVNGAAFQSGLKAGDSLLFRRGDTFGHFMLENVRGREDNPVTVSAYGEGEKPLFRYAGNTVELKFCDNFVIRDIAVEVIGVERSPSNPAQRTGLSIQYDHAGGEKFENVYVFDNEIYSQGVDRNTFGIEVTAASQNYESSPTEVLSNLHVKRNEVHDVGRSGIHTIGWLIDEGYNNVKWTMYRDFFIDENTVYNVGCMGIYITCCTNSTINRNLIYNAGAYDKAELMEGECGIMALSSDTMDIMFNEIYGCLDQKLGYDAMGIDIDWNTRNINVKYNHCYDNLGSGVGTMANRDCFIRNNRLENNKGETGGHAGQISVTAFTSRVYGVPEDFHSVRGLTIEENLLIGTPDGKNMFCSSLSNGDADWTDNVFRRNHVVYTGDDPSKMRFIFVDDSAPWYDFSENRYYSAKTSVFKCYDNTEAADIAAGSQPYGGQSMKFENWLKRDAGATYENLSDAAPSAPSAAAARLENGKITLSWEASEGNLWHYNVYLVGADEDVSYPDMLGETAETAFSFTPAYAGEYYFVIQPESDQGVYGKALKIKVEMR